MVVVPTPLAALMVVGGLVVVIRLITAPERPTARVDMSGLPDDPRHAVRRMDLERDATERILEPIARYLRNQLRRVTPVSRLEAVSKKLVWAGLAESKWTAESVMGVKFAATGVGILFGVMMLSAGLSSSSLMKSALAIGVFYMVPETLLTRRVNDRQKKIQNDLPDVIDQITVSVEAGLSFDGAMQRAGEEGKGPLAEEFVKVVGDLQIGMSREEALDALLERTKVPDLRQFVLAIRQATRYGLPIARVLRVQSNEMREKRRARAENKAMQVPVKITFPLVFFILPALFIVIIGPAALQMTGKGGL